MADDGFLRRWARRKAENRQRDGEPVSAAAPAPLPTPAHAGARADTVAPADAGTCAHARAPVPAGAPEAPPRPPPTLDDLARLTPDADFSAFVARGVDTDVRRAAMKKLFADPHFHAMDGLDVYIDDYTKPSPVGEAMLAALAHARSVLRIGAGDEDKQEPRNDLKPRHDEHPPDADTDAAA